LLITSNILLAKLGLFSLSVQLNNHRTTKFSINKSSKQAARTSVVALSLKLYSGYKIPGKDFAALIEKVAMLNPQFFEEMLNL
jgi:hypothetical protein